MDWRFLLAASISVAATTGQAAASSTRRPARPGRMPISSPPMAIRRPRAGWTPRFATPRAAEDSAAARVSRRARGSRHRRPAIGTTLAQLDEFIDAKVLKYDDLLTAKAVRGASNDYPRTRTGKVIEKLTLLREEMQRPPHNGHPFDRMPRASSASSVGRGPHPDVGRGVHREGVQGVGNQNRSSSSSEHQLHAMHAVRAHRRRERDAESGGHAGSVDVYKVWWGFRPDGSFAGRIEETRGASTSSRKPKASSRTTSSPTERGDRIVR